MKDKKPNKTFFTRLKEYWKNLGKSHKRILIFTIILWFLFPLYLFFFPNTTEKQIEELQKDYEQQYHINQLDEAFFKKHEVVGVNQPTFTNVNYFEVTVNNKKEKKLDHYKIYKTLGEEWTEYTSKINLLLEKEKENSGVGLYVKPKNILLMLLVEALPLLILIGFLAWMMRKQFMGDNEGSKISTYATTEKNRVKFEDIGGISTQKEEILSMIDTIKSIKKLKKRGVRVPRGMLLFGPPGVGKTMIAKAIAGEASIDMFLAKGTDFKSKWYGEGSKNVDRAFAKIKSFLQKHEKEVAILFIDEIENLLQERGTGHSADDDIVNTFLDKIDGISGTTNIILIGATNHINKIDSAARSRFDIELGFSLPDMPERKDIISKILKKRKKKDKNLIVDENIDIGLLASYTTGQSGRFIESIINEAHIEAIKKDKSISTRLLMDTWEDRSIGKEKLEKDSNEEDAKTVVIHELGHGIIGHMEGKRVVKLTNIPRGRALGICFSIPKTEENLRTPETILGEVRQLFAGRMAEEVFCNRITTGASNDLEKIEQILFQYLSLYDFSYKGLGLNYVLDKGMLNNPSYLAQVKEDTKPIVQKIFKEEKEFIKKFFKETEVQKLFWEMHKELLSKRNLYEADFNSFLDKSSVKDLYNKNHI